MYPSVFEIVGSYGGKDARLGLLVAKLPGLQGCFRSKYIKFVSLKH
jgi:hypothetical protein